MLLATFAAWILAAPPEATPVDEDISTVDKPAVSDREKKRQEDIPRLEARVIQRVESAPSISIAQGDTVFLVDRFEIKKTPKGAVIPRLLRPKTVEGIHVVPWLESIAVTAVKTGAEVTIGYAIRVKPLAKLGTFNFSLSVELKDAASLSPLGIGEVTHQIEVSAPSPNAELVELDRKAFLHFQSDAREAYRALPELHHYLRLDRLDPPPESRLDAEKKRFLDRFYQARLRADVAEQHLRAAIKSSDGKVQESAVIALGSLNRRAEGAAAQARIVEGKGPKEALIMAEERFKDFDLDEAEGILIKLRKGKVGELEKKDLAQTLQLLGALYAARGQEEKARTHYGQSSCLEPGGEAPSLLNPMKRIHDQVRQQKRCDRPITLGTITAQRQESELGTEIKISVPVGPDPYRLISGGDIILYGSGGGVLLHEKVRAEQNEATVLSCVLPDEERLLNLEGRLLLSAIARDVSGVAIATAGVPEPQRISIESAPGYSETVVPWWVWLLGGIAVASAAATTLIVTYTGERDRGIGPINGSF